MFRRRFLSRQVGLKFTDESSSNLNASQAGIQYENSPSGEMNIGVVWNTEVSNLYIYKVTTGNELTSEDSLVSGDIIYFVVHIGSKKYIVGIDNNALIYQEITSVSSYSNSYTFQWFYFCNGNKFRVENRQNQNLRLKVQDDGTLAIDSDSSSYVFYRDGSLVNKLFYSETIWHVINNNSKASLNTNANGYTAFVYTYTVSTSSGWLTTRRTFTLTKVAASSALTNQNAFLVLQNQNGNYYLVGRNSSDDSSKITSISPSSTSDNTIVFTTSNNTLSDYRYYVTVNGTISLSAYSNSNYYLRPPTISNNADLYFSNSNYLFSYDDTTGLHIKKESSSYSNFGIESIGTQLDATSTASSAGTTILFRKDGANWSPYYGSLNTGETYAIVVRKAPDDDEPNPNYYLVGAEGDKLTSHTFSTLNDIDIGSDSEFVATAGTWGCGLTSGSYGLNVNNNNMALLAVSLDWVYTGDSTTPENSRLWSATTQTVNYYPEYRNSDLEADTQATDMTCDIFLVQNGKVQIQADEFVDGCTYVLVFVDNGNHYAACVNGTDIVPVLYANALPKNLPSEYHFVAEESGQGFILKNNNQAMGVATSTKLALGYNAVWTYTGGTT